MKWERGLQPFWVRLPIQSGVVTDFREIAGLSVDGVKAWREAHEVQEWPRPTGRVAYEVDGSTVVVRYEWALSE